jgi:hypothetical protein
MAILLTKLQKMEKIIRFAATFMLRKKSKYYNKPVHAKKLRTHRFS